MKPMFQIPRRSLRWQLLLGALLTAPLLNAAEIPDAARTLRQQAPVSALLASTPAAIANPLAAPDPLSEPLAFGATGCNATIRSVLVQGRTAWLGGDFVLCGDRPAAHVVALDLDTGLYASLGEGVDGPVDAIALLNGRLVVAGRFQQAGGRPAPSLALWDGQQWSALAPAGLLSGDGSQPQVLALAVYGGALVVGGRFSAVDGVSANHVALWRDGVWQALGEGVDAQVNTLAVFRGELAVGGRFQQAGRVEAPLAAFWDGLQWRASGAEFLAGPVSGQCTSQREVRRLRVFGDELVMVGQLRPANPPVNVSQTTAGIYVDNQWLEVTRSTASVGCGPSASFTLDNGLHDVGRLDGSYVGLAGTGTLPDKLVPLDGSFEWSIAPTLVLTNLGGQLLAAGPVSGNGPLSFLGREDDALVVRPLARARVSGEVRAHLADGDGIIVGGSFNQVGGVTAANIARWNGADWQPLGQGTDGQVNALAHFAGELVAGGDFDKAGGAPASRIARWDGQQWRPLGAGINPEHPYVRAEVRALAEFQGELYVGGRFSAGTSGGRSLAIWDGQDWRALQVDGVAAGMRFRPICSSPLSCFTAEASASVNGLQVHDGALFLSGQFNQVEGPLGFPTDSTPVLRWDGQSLSHFGATSWTADGFKAIASVSNGRVGRFAVDAPPAVLNGELYFAFDPFVGSVMDPVEGALLHANVARWDSVGGSEHSALAPGGADFHTITSLRSHAGALYATGPARQDSSRRSHQLARLEADGLRPVQPVGLADPGNERSVLSAAGEALLVGDLPFARLGLAQTASLSASGQPAPAGAREPRLSHDARWLVYSAAVAGAAARSEVYRRHLLDGRVEALGAQVVAAGLAEPGTSFAAPAISGDGLTVAFAGDDGGIYLIRNAIPRRLKRSDAERGLQPALSPDGRYAGYRYERGAESGLVIRHLVNGAEQDFQGDYSSPSLSASGRAIATSGPTGDLVYLAFEPDRFLLQTRWRDALINAVRPSMQLSADGRFGVFSSSADALLADDDNGVEDVYWFEANDRGELLQLRRVSVDSVGAQANGASHSPSISADGQTVAFISAADNLVELDHNGVEDLFIHLIVSGETRRMNGTDDFQSPAAGASRHPALSGDGSAVAFATLADNLGAVDGVEQVAISRFATPALSDGHLPSRFPRAERIPLPATPQAACPGGYHTAVIEDGPRGGLTPGGWGMELLLLEPGSRLLAGGLNFGSQIGPTQPGFAGFNLANANAEPQVLNLSISGEAFAGQASLPVRLILQRQEIEREVLYQTDIELRPGQPFEHELVLQPGYHVLVVESRVPAGNPAQARADGQFLLSATTGYLDRPGGGFQGGAVVGGYHDQPGDGASGFAGFCLPEAGDISARVLGLDNPGAADLQLRLLDSTFEESLLLR